MSDFEPIPLENFLRYWRNSLADEDMMGAGKADGFHPVSLDEARGNALSQECVERLREDWKDHLRRFSRNVTAADLDSPDDTQMVPVIVLAGGLAKETAHGTALNARNRTVFYTLSIPAILDGEGLLKPNPESPPWIGREFLAPNEDADEALPLLGELQAFDDWLSREPTNECDWEGLIEWCDGLMSHVTGDRLPDGFVALDKARIGLSTDVRGAARNLCQLYDALVAEKSLPALLQRMICGTDEAGIVTRKTRIEQFAAPRGTMGMKHGLADSQSDAVAAFTRMEGGEILAVNGPPGTGKTTLLQSIIATEVVRRAIDGDEPAVIVGVSTNNQAVTNINRSLNEILKENDAGERFPWARRWVPDADTYGLYLPTMDKASAAVASGFVVAVKNRDQWSGFPERERDDEYVGKAGDLWAEGFALTYGQRPDSIEAGIEVLRDDLRHLVGRLEAMVRPLVKLEESEAWWSARAGGVEPETFIEDVARQWASRIEELTERHQFAEVALGRAEEENQALIASAEEPYTTAKAALDEAQRALAHAADINKRVVNEGSAQGLSEHLAALLPPLRRSAEGRQCARVLAVVSSDPWAAARFVDIAGASDPARWRERAGQLVKEASDLVMLRTGEFQTAEARLRTARAAAEDKLKSAEQAVEDAAKAISDARGQAAAEADLLKSRLDELRERRQGVAADYARLRDEVQDKEAVPERPGVADFDRLVDMSVRHELFQKAMRYWEGRWILEARKVQAGEVNTRSGRIGVEAMFRRWCMLTPCLVSTLHSLPKHFRSNSKTGGKWVSNFLLEYVDLLIMDESGQVAPHVGMAAFAMAKRAVVVGDIFQIEPVVQASKGMDYANALRYGLGSLWEGGFPLTPHMISDPNDGSPQGSVMRLAQAATAATSPGMTAERGIFLSEHRRCLPEIVAYCNDLVYSGRLVPMTRKPDNEPPLPPMCWAHVRGSNAKERGSNVNTREAEAIAGWIASHAEEWTRHYKMPIEEIVAVVTPFRGQMGAIRSALERHGDSFSSLTVGTVHGLQGADRPIVVFSPTYSADNMKGGMFFDRKPNMLNVAVSRAKHAFVVIGDMRLFRRSGKNPSTILGRSLFASPENELGDVDGNHQFPKTLLVHGERISNLERHRELLRGAFEGAGGGRSVFIASPWITLRAIVAEDLDRLCSEAVRRGATIHLVVDREWTHKTPGYRSEEAIRLMTEAGATVTRVDGMHNKTLIAGPKEIVEGSFNWLSANRLPGDSRIRHETSWRITGDASASAIASAIKEFKKMGVPVAATRSSAAE